MTGSGQQMKKMTPADSELLEQGITPLLHSQVYKTSDLALSAFLHALGHQLKDIHNHGGKGIFAFDESPRLRADLIRWVHNEPVAIKVREFVNLQRDLKGMVGIR
jgi:Domain of unknown function (DUF5659)